MNAQICTRNDLIIGSVRLADGLITELGSRDSNAPIIDCEGDFILPGLIDVHTDAFEKHATPRPGVSVNPLSALLSHDAVLLASGITTSFDSLVAGGVGSPARRALLPAALAALGVATADNLLRITHLLHIRCDLTDRTTLDIMEPFWAHPLLRFVTTIDDSPKRNPERAVWLFEKRRGLPAGSLMAGVEPLTDEDFDATDETRATIAGRCQSLGIPIGNHDDTRAEHIEAADRLGIRISEFPIRRASAEAARYYGHATICGAPNLLNGGSHIDNVSVAELLGAKLVDVLCSDYIPQSLLSAAFRLIEPPFDMALPQAIAMMSAKPADVFSLNDRGVIEVGKRADLIQVRVASGVPTVRRVWIAGEIALQPLMHGSSSLNGPSRHAVDRHALPSVK